MANILIKVKNSKDKTDKEQCDKLSVELPPWVFNTNKEFMVLYGDILNSRTLNPIQQQVIDCFFKDNCGRIFLRIGRKGSKTSTIIMVAWLFSHLRDTPTITNILYPTKEQGYDVMWEESRLQNCDLVSTDLRENWVHDVDDKKMSITFNNGSIIRIHGTWTEKRGRGVQPDFLISDELKDINPEFLSGFEPNLAAKPDSRFLLAGTPPKKRNHYHEWEERSIKKLGGRHFHFSSYINTSLPHLKKWLDDTREELIAAGKEDEWKREYMAEDCFSSEERMLPDATFIDSAEIMERICSIPLSNITYVVGIKVTISKMSAVYFAIQRQKFSPTRIYVLDYILKKNVWDGSFKEFMNKIPEKCAVYSHEDYKSWKKLVHDESNSFSSVIPSFSLCNQAKDSKWQNRGIPLMREMMHEGIINFSNNIYPMGLEIQGLLIGDDFDLYPLVSVCAMVCNEYYHQPINKPKPERELNDVEKICQSLNLKPPRKEKGQRLFSYKWGR